MEWNEIGVGTRAEWSVKIDWSDVDTFRNLTNDYNPIHYAMENPIVYGMLTTSFVSTLIGEHLPGHGAIIASTSFDYLAPVHVGDTLLILGAVKKKSEAKKTLVIGVDIQNQNGDSVVNGTVMVVAP